MSAATDALAAGMTELQLQLGKDFTFGGTTFTALTEPRERKDDFERSYNIDDQWDTELVVDPTASAFSSGLPAQADIVIQSSNSRKFSVVSVDYDDGDHVAYLQVRKLG